MFWFYFNLNRGKRTRLRGKSYEEKLEIKIEVWKEDSENTRKHYESACTHLEKEEKNRAEKCRQQTFFAYIIHGTWSFCDVRCI